MARLFGVKEKELLVVWLADKILDVIENEDDAKNDALTYAQDAINQEKNNV